MGVEVVGFEAAHVPAEAVAAMDNSFLHEKENGKLGKGPEVNEPIQFGSHEEAPVKGEVKDAADANLPKDAVDEWPAPQRIHSFYIVRYHQYDDPSIKAKIDQADKEVHKRNLSHNRISEELYAKKATRQELRNQLRTLRTENGQYRSVLDEKKTKIAPLQQALGKMRNPNSNAGRSTLCSSEEELNDVIYSLNYRIQHESIPLSEEKQILKEIRQLELTREKVIANADERTKLQESFGQKEAIQDQVKLMGSDLDGVRKEQQAVWAKIVQLEEKVKALNGEIVSLEEQRQAEIEKRNKAYETIRELRKKRDEGNANFFQSRKVLTEARELAAKKDVKALEEFSLAEGDKFISSWCNNKSFRDDYEKRILQSLDRRQMSRDGRIRNPDEKPLVTYGAPTPADPQPAVKAAAVKRPKEEPKSVQQKDAPAAPKAQKDIKAENKTQSKNVEQDDIVDREIFVPDVVEKNLPSAEEEVDPVKLKELKREEEIAKAKLAMERKKKLAEKAAAKAAIRAEKEAEKKLKDREKKLKKKAAATTTDPEEPSETVAEVEEAEKVEANEEAAAVPVKEKFKREVKHRIRPRVGKDAHPKALLKRKKSNNYWLWAAPAAVLVLLLLALGYYYYLM